MSGLLRWGLMQGNAARVAQLELLASTVIRAWDFEATYADGFFDKVAHASLLKNQYCGQGIGSQYYTSVSGVGHVTNSGGGGAARLWTPDSTLTSHCCVSMWLDGGQPPNGVGGNMKVAHASLEDGGLLGPGLYWFGPSTYEPNPFYSYPQTEQIRPAWFAGEDSGQMTGYTGSSITGGRPFAVAWRHCCVFFDVDSEDEVFSVRVAYDGAILGKVEGQAIPASFASGLGLLWAYERIDDLVVFDVPTAWTDESALEFARALKSNPSFVRNLEVAE